LFYEVKEIKYEFDDIENCPPVVFHVWDRDKGLLNSSNDYMGSAIIYLNNASVYQ
jgi:hypothetical protein